MFDPTFGPTTLGRQIRKSDFYKNTHLSRPGGVDKCIRDAVMISKKKSYRLNLSKNFINGRSVYRLSDFPTELVLRKAALNLKTIARARQANRLEIIRRLKLFCEEGLPFCIAKFDIKEFYESVDHTAMQKVLTQRLSTSPSTRRVLEKFVIACGKEKITGLPRGLAISAALSELYMRDFDIQVQQALSPYFYARYVDDIIIVLPPEQKLNVLRKRVIEMLPFGLTLNARKTRLLTFTSEPKSAPSEEHNFDYLGFSFSVNETKKTKNRITRAVQLDIAPSKVRKKKTRIVRSLIQYTNDGNFNDLKDRFKLIICNYKFFDHKKSRERLAGNYHTYGLIDFPSDALSELDRFVKHVLLSKHGSLSSRLRLSRTQRRELLRLSFTRAFHKETHFHFSADRLNKLMECWKYV